MQTLLIIFLMIVFLILFTRILDRLTNPIVRIAGKYAGQIRKARVLARMLPEGQLLNLAPNVVEIGMALIIDGQTTRQANATMLDILEEQGRQSKDLYWYGGRTIRVPGYDRQ